MPSVFTRIIAGELPADFVWKDDQAVAFLSNRPLRPGHILVEPALLAHLVSTAQAIARAQMEVFKPARIGLILVGLEVPHVHFHVVPIDGPHDLDFDNQDPDPDPAMMTKAGDSLRKELRKAGSDL